MLLSYTDIAVLHIIFIHRFRNEMLQNLKMFYYLFKYIKLSFKNAESHLIDFCQIIQLKEEVFVLVSMWLLLLEKRNTQYLQ